MLYTAPNADLIVTNIVCSLNPDGGIPHFYV
jgi:hypothetical protein